MRIFPKVYFSPYKKDENLLDTDGLFNRKLNIIVVYYGVTLKEKVWVLFHEFTHFFNILDIIRIHALLDTSDLIIRGLFDREIRATISISLVLRTYIWLISEFYKKLEKAKFCY